MASSGGIGDPEKLRRLMGALHEVTEDVPLLDSLRRCVESTCALVDARYGALGVLDASRTGLEHFFTVGLTPQETKAIGPRPTGVGVLGLLITDHAPLRLARVTDHPSSVGFPDAHPSMTSFLGVPLQSGSDVYGNLYLAEKEGADAFTEEDQAVAEAMAHAAGLVIANARLRDRVRVLSVSDDRERIARDMHDRVIQRIFAVGMTLQGATYLTDVDQVIDRVRKAVDDLDATITEIRTAIFEFGESRGPGGLRQAVIGLADELVPSLGTRPEVIFEGPVDTAVPSHLSEDVLTSIREGLLLASRHGNAANYKVSVRVDDDLVVQMDVDGDFIGETADDGCRQALADLRDRAEKLSGTFEVTELADAGTRLSWSLPL